MRPLIFFDAARESFTDLDTRGITVGIDKNFTYENENHSRHPGQHRQLHSDGLESALNTSGAAYSTGRIKDIIRLNRGTPRRCLFEKSMTFSEILPREAPSAATSA